jgi:hypothetical protein
VKGVGLIYKPGEALPERLEFDRPPELQELKNAIGGGYLELVPGFTSIAASGIPRRRLRCVAFCDEHGKLAMRDRGIQAFNLTATLLWESAEHRVRDEHGDFIDYLVGPVLVLFGDDEFMESL